MNDYFEFKIDKKWHDHLQRYYDLINAEGKQSIKWSLYKQFLRGEQPLFSNTMHGLYQELELGEARLTVTTQLLKNQIDDYQNSPWYMRIWRRWVTPREITAQRRILNYLEAQKYYHFFKKHYKGNEQGEFIVQESLGLFDWFNRHFFKDTLSSNLAHVGLSSLREIELENPVDHRDEWIKDQRIISREVDGVIQEFEEMDEVSQIPKDLLQERKNNLVDNFIRPIRRKYKELFISEEVDVFCESEQMRLERYFLESAATNIVIVSNDNNNSPNSYLPVLVQFDQSSLDEQYERDQVKMKEILNDIKASLINAKSEIQFNEAKALAIEKLRKFYKFDIAKHFHPDGKNDEIIKDAEEKFVQFKTALDQLLEKLNSITHRNAYYSVNNLQEDNSSVNSTEDDCFSDLVAKWEDLYQQTLSLLDEYRKLRKEMEIAHKKSMETSTQLINVLKERNAAQEKYNEDLVEHLKNSEDVITQKILVKLYNHLNDGGMKAYQDNNNSSSGTPVLIQCDSTLDELYKKDQERLRTVLDDIKINLIRAKSEDQFNEEKVLAVEKIIKFYTFDMSKNFHPDGENDGVLKNAEEKFVEFKDKLDVLLERLNLITYKDAIPSIEDLFNDDDQSFFDSSYKDFCIMCEELNNDYREIIKLCAEIEEVQNRTLKHLEVKNQNAQQLLSELDDSSEALMQNVAQKIIKKLAERYAEKIKFHIDSSQNLTSNLQNSRLSEEREVIIPQVRLQK